MCYLTFLYINMLLFHFFVLGLNLHFGCQLLLTASARVAQVIEWLYFKTKYQSHEEGVVLVMIKYLGY